MSVTIFQPSETLDIAARERYKLERRLVIICLEEGEKCGWKRWRKLECGEWLTTIVAPRFFDCSLDFGNGRWPFPVDPCESSTVVGLEHDDEATLVLEGLVLLHRFRHSSVRLLRIQDVKSGNIESPPTTTQTTLQSRNHKVNPRHPKRRA